MRMLKIIGALVAFFVLPLGVAPTADAKSQPSAHIYVAVDTGGGVTLLEEAEKMRENLLHTLDATRRIKRRNYPRLEVTLIDMARRKIMFSGTPRELADMSGEELTAMIEPSSVCAPFTPFFNYLDYRLSNDGASDGASSDAYLVIVSPLIDVNDSFCDQERTVLPPSPPIAPEAGYGLERIFARSELKGAFFLGWHHLQEPVWDTFITDLEGVEPIFVAKGTDMHSIFAGVRRDEE